MNLFSLAKEFPTEEAALDYWVKIRWPDVVKCVECGHDKVYQIDTKGKTGKPCRKYECAKCGLHFSPTAGTLFHDSHLPMQKWFAAIALMCEAKKGISANQMKRHIGVTYKTAWYMCHRIREAMQESDKFTVGGPYSTVEIDETFVGGFKRLEGHKAGHTNKTAVIGLAERNGKIYMEALPRAKREPIQKVVDSKLDPDTPKVITDGKSLYRKVIPQEKHEEHVHKRELKTRNVTSTHTVESAFSLFKRGVVGSYHKVGRYHLNGYLGEFCWRYNRRRKQNLMFNMALRNMKRKPLPYRSLVETPKLPEF